MSTGGGAIYFRIDVNSSPVRYAYLTGGLSTTDANVAYTGELSVGNTIRIYQQNACSAAWEGQHSSYQIILIKRT
jgi:hypothetical protein